MRSNDSNAKKEKIFAAAKEIIASQGLDGFTMAALGEITGLGMGTIYSYFPTKEDIIQGLYLDIQQRHTHEIFDDVNFEEPFMIVFKQMFYAYFLDRWNNYQDYLFIDQFRVSPYESEEAQQLEDMAFRQVNALLDRGKRELLVKFVDNKFLATYVIGGVKDIVREMKRYGLPLDDIAINRAFELSVSVILR